MEPVKGVVVKPGQKVVYFAVVQPPELGETVEQDEFSPVSDEKQARRESLPASDEKYNHTLGKDKMSVSPKENEAKGPESQRHFEYNMREKEYNKLEEDQIGPPGLTTKYPKDTKI